MQTQAPGGNDGERRALKGRLGLKTGSTHCLREADCRQKMEGAEQEPVHVKVAVEETSFHVKEDEKLMRSSLKLTDNDPDDHEGSKRHAPEGGLLTAYAAAHNPAHTEELVAEEPGQLNTGKKTSERRERG